MSLLRLFQWFGHTAVGVFMQQSTYAFAIVEMIHLLSLTVLGGVILIVDLRVVGLGLKSQTASTLALQLNPFLVWSLVVGAISGVLLLSEEPIKCYYNAAFRAKMLFLIVAVAFYFFVQRRLSGRSAKWAGVFSLLLWLCVGLAGRAIGFL